MRSAVHPEVSAASVSDLSGKTSRTPPPITRKQDSRRAKRMILAAPAQPDEGPKANQNARAIPAITTVMPTKRRTP